MILSIVIRMTPLLLLLAGCSGCDERDRSYGDTHVEVRDLNGFYWPTTGKVVQDFYGTESVPDAGYWFDKDGNMSHHPGGFNFHRGIDIENARGTRIYAAHKGIVSDVTMYGSSAPSGNTVLIMHPDSPMFSSYCHLDSVDVAKGQWVTPNTVIGRMGDSGNQNRVHLHFGFQILYRNQYAHYWTAGALGEVRGSGEPFISPLKDTDPSDTRVRVK